LRLGAEDVPLAGVLVVAMFLGCALSGIGAGRHIASEGHDTARLKRFNTNGDPRR
jgi:hypothetical protein